MKRWILELIALVFIASGVIAVGVDNPDWTLPVSIRAQEISSLAVDITAQSVGNIDVNIASQSAAVQVDVTNSSLDVNVTNSTITIQPATGTVFTIAPESTAVFNVSGSVDANITNTSLDVNVTNSSITVTGSVAITNSSLDVNVTNSTLTVEVSGTAAVDIQNAELNVKNLREQVVSTSDLVGFSTSQWVSSLSSITVTLYTNSGTSTVYLEYLTTAVQGPSTTTVSNTLSPMAVTWAIQVKNSAGTVLYTFYANGNLFMNFDPAIPVPAGGSIVVTMVNRSSEGMFLYASGVVRTIS